MSIHGPESTVYVGGGGDVVGPASATNNNLAQFDGTTGKLLEDSGVAVDTDGTLAANSDTKLATQKAVKTYADQLIAAADAMVFQGVIDCSANPNYPAADAGDTYKVSVAGKIGGGSGPNVEVGDLLLCTADATSSGNHATVGTSWAITQVNIDGAVTGPTSATDSNFVQFDGTTGRVIKNSAYGPSSFQAADAELAAIAGLTSAADKGIQFTGSGTAATYDLTAAGKALLDDADASAQKATLGLAAVASSGSAADLSTGILDPDRLQPMRRKNLNGDMRIDQQFAGAASNSMATGVYPIDQWCYVTTQSGKFNGGRDLGSGTKPAGFSRYLGLASTSAFSGAITDTFSLYHDIEGYDVADLAWGSADAKAVTLSFWVYSSQTGTFGGSVQNSGATRSYPFSFTISSSNTWEQKTVTIAGDTSGTWLTTNGIGMSIQFDLGCGSNFAGTAATWATADYRTVSGATKIVATNAATYRITGVQLEEGSLASPFERRLIGSELQQLVRYYTKSYAMETAVGTSPGTGGNATIKFGHATSVSATWNFFTTRMRDAPTLAFYDSVGTVGKVSYYTGSWSNNGAVSFSAAKEIGFYLDASISTAFITNLDFAASARMR